MRTAIEIAAQIWCDPRCSNIEMDARLAGVFAEQLEPLLNVVEAARNIGHESGCENLEMYGIGVWGKCDCPLKAILEAIAELDKADVG